jgi:trehalose synthase
MARVVDPQHHVALDDYDAVAHLSRAVRDLREEAHSLVPLLEGRRVWMVNSTERGGGVAEMLPGMLTLLRQLGIDARWLVLEAEDPEFFRLTKRLHNLIHGQGDPRLTESDRALYDSISETEGKSIARQLSPGDILVVHDPQPLGAGRIASEACDITTIWRCHIGLDRASPETRSAWNFLRPDATHYDRSVFSAPEYIPDFLAGSATIIHPGIDPLSHKNRELPIHKLVGILTNGSLIQPLGPVITPPFPEPAMRLQADGSWRAANEPEDIGLLTRPIVTQISRWDRLKGFLPLLKGFVRLKRDLLNGTELDSRYQRTLDTARLVLAGPDPGSVADDPEAQEVMDELRAVYVSLAPEVQGDVAIISLPMSSPKYNALMVNALQRCSDIVVQNSLQEGFGLTATEAMWKHAAVLVSRAAGLRQQIRPGLEGCVISNPEDEGEIALRLSELLEDQRLRERLGRNAQRRVHHDFLVFSQLRRWIEVFVEVAGGHRPDSLAP